jgi:hypothetical protein
VTRHEFRARRKHLGAARVCQCGQAVHQKPRLDNLKRAKAVTARDTDVFKEIYKRVLALGTPALGQLAELDLLARRVTASDPLSGRSSIARHAGPNGSTG